MQPRLAFTAEFWGDSAVVCRALENCAGPIVDQQFGLFKTWTHAQAFALRLNQGLKVEPSQARQIVTSSKLLTDMILAATASQGPQTKLSLCLDVSNEVQMQFILAELHLALTFCRLVGTTHTPNANRMIRNARNALFNALHFALHSDLGDSEFQQIVTTLEILKVALLRASLPKDRELDESRLGGK